MMAFRTLRSKCALLAPVCLLVLGAARNAAADTITVGWDQASSTVGYRVHIGVQSGNYTQHFDVGSANLYAFTTATAGQRYCFAVSAYMLSTQLEGPNSNEVCGYSNQSPTLVNPGARTSTVGQPTSLQLQGFDSQPLTYSATGLPPGLSVGASTGYISGTGTTAGTYNVTARASDGVLSTSQSFSWTMTTSSTSGGTTSPPTSGSLAVTITSPTTGTSYSTSLESLPLAGNASGSTGVARVVWENVANGVRGVASGTTSWSIAGIPLQAGSNPLAITAYDNANNPVTRLLTVTRSSTTTTPSAPSTSDPTAPSVTITSPTSGASYSTTQSTINLTGIASDNTSVARVVWENVANGARGVASGTTNWAIAGLPLQAGTNLISITVYDNAGNSGGDSLVVTRSSTTTTPSTPPPTSSGSLSVTVTSPFTGTSYSTSQSSLNLTGNASGSVARVVWENVANGARGVASGTTSWSIAGMPLVAGTNSVAITAYDTAGNPFTLSLLVTRSSTTTTTTPPTTTSGTPPTLRLDPGGRFEALLYWTSTSWSSVDVYRNNTRIKSVSNTGATNDIAPTYGSYSYKLCAPGSTTNCSNSINISF
jgi:hypothetical protein